MGAVCLGGSGARGSGEGLCSAHRARGGPDGRATRPDSLLLGLRLVCVGSEGGQLPPETSPGLCVLQKPARSLPLGWPSPATQPRTTTGAYGLRHGGRSRAQDPRRQEQRALGGPSRRLRGPWGRKGGTGAFSLPAASCRVDGGDSEPLPPRGTPSPCEDLRGPRFPGQVPRGEELGLP